MPAKTYTLQRLNEFCEQLNLTLLKDYSQINMNSHTIIEGICCSDNCIECDSFAKTFRNIVRGGGPYCKKCVEKRLSEKMKQTNFQRYGVEHPMQNSEIQEKTKQTNFQRYGVENPMQNSEIQEKVKQTMQNSEIQEKKKQTNFQRYGVENPMQNSEIQEKFKQTNFQRYGCQNPFQNSEIQEKMKQTNFQRYGFDCSLKNSKVQEKVKQTNFERYGVEHPMQNSEIQEKTKQTNFQRYGVGHPMQNSEFQSKIQKKSYKRKLYVYPSGKEEYVQGYEPFGLNDLLFIEQVNENDIITNRSDIPRVSYLDEEGKSHYYFVDIYIPSQQRCIEVKSAWTLKMKKDNVFLKQQALKDAGYQCEIWVYNDKGTRVACHV